MKQDSQLSASQVLSQNESSVPKLGIIFITRFFLSFNSPDLARFYFPYLHGSPLQIHKTKKESLFTAHRLLFTFSLTPKGPVPQFPIAMRPYEPAANLNPGFNTILFVAFMRTLVPNPPWIR